MALQEWMSKCTLRQKQLAASYIGIFLLTWLLTNYICTFNFYSTGIFSLIFGLFVTKKIVSEFLRTKYGEKVDPANKCVFVTGCDTGFGHELTKRLSANGFHVFSGCLFPEGEGAKKLRDLKGVTVIGVDVTKEDSVLDARKIVEEQLEGRELWSIVNNAGVALDAPFEWMSMDAIRKQMDINVTGPMLVTRAFLPLLRKSKGRVVNVCSIFGHFTAPAMTVYCMTKHAMVSFTNGLNLELRRFGIKAIQINPTFYRTPIVAKRGIVSNFQRYFETMPEEVQNAYGERSLERYEALFGRLLTTVVREKVWEVVDAMHDAISAEEPKLAYWPGGIGEKVTMQLIVAVLPTDWMNRLGAFMDNYLLWLVRFAVKNL